MSQYFIKRGEKIHGPFSTKQVKSGLESGKLKDADLISESKDGPWQPVTEQLDQPIQQIPITSQASQQPSNSPNLVQCKDCGGTVSVQAVTCPHCGTPNPSGATGVLVIKRRKGYVGFLAATEVAINESPIGKIKCDGVMRINLMPGEHLLGFGREIKSEAAGRLRSINITIYPNKETIVEWKLTLSAFKILSITNR